MVAGPGDLVASRQLAPADGKPAAAAVERYLNDKVPALPAATSLGRIIREAEDCGERADGGKCGNGGWWGGLERLFGWVVGGLGCWEA